MSNPFEGLREIARACFENSRDHGWHEETEFGRTLREVSDFMEREQLGTSRMRSVLQRYAAQHARDRDVPIMTKLALIAAEVGEAIEAYRDPNMDPTKSYYVLKDEDSPDTFLCEMPPVGSEMAPEDSEKTERSKPEGLGSELADIVIRVFDLAGMLKIDIANEIERKMRYNVTRPYRHGGKLA